MANDVKKTKKRVDALTHEMCDMLRDKAKELGHKAAGFPDEVLNKYIDVRDKNITLIQAKLYVQNYMLGKVDAQEFAKVMAENDNLRYTISDLCSARLEPPDFNITRGTGYLDFVAGAKTFWSEIKVPLPSEIEAAKDLKNIYYGIEAGMAAAGGSRSEQKTSQDASANKKRSFREILSDTRQKLAAAAVDKLTPIAEGKMDESKWMETDKGREYHDDCTRRAAQHIENVAMAVEAGKDKNLSEEARMDALRAAGMDAEAAEAVETVDKEAIEVKTGLKSGHSLADICQPVDVNVKELLDQISVNMDRDYLGNDRKQTPDKNMDKEARGKRYSRDARDDEVKTAYQGETVIFKKTWSGHTFTDDEITKLANDEPITFQYTDKKGKERTATGKLEWQEHDGHEYLGFKLADPSKKNDKTADEDNSLFTNDDEKLINHSFPDPNEEYINEDYAGFDNEDADENIGLSAQDLANLFSDGQQL